MRVNQVSADYQRTLASELSLRGVGVHSGRECDVTVMPAAGNSGIVFEITGARINATLSAALGNRHQRQTILGDPAGAHVATPEHLLSALSAMGVDNALVRLSAPELPLLDGGSREYTEAIAAAGLMAQAAPRQSLSISRPVAFSPSNGVARFSAHPFDGLAVTYFVDFGDKVVRRMGASFIITPETYRVEIAPARTIAFEREIEALRRAGLGLGGSLDSVIVIGETGYLNDSLLFPDEVVRHKILDLIGDLSLAGLPLRGHILAERTGHADNILFVQFLKEQFE